MTSWDRVFVVVAAYNEQTVIGQVAASLLAIGVEVVVVCDGSTDETAAQALKAGARLVRHPMNLGQGAALQTGITYALRAGAEQIVTFDADGQHDPLDVPKLVERLESEGVDVILGSRFLGKTERLPALRRVVLNLAVLFTRLTSGLRLTDTHNGLRAFSRAAAQQLHIRQDRMAHASEVLEQIGALHLR